MATAFGFLEFVWMSLESFSFVAHFGGFVSPISRMCATLQIYASICRVLNAEWNDGTLDWTLERFLHS